MHNDDKVLHILDLYLKHIPEESDRVWVTWASTPGERLNESITEDMSTWMADNNVLLSSSIMSRWKKHVVPLENGTQPCCRVGTECYSCCAFEGLVVVAIVIL